MRKKVKCNECANSMKWELPSKLTSKNIEYARRCLSLARISICCSESMKSKGVQHVQYCKKFRIKSEMDYRMDAIHQDDIVNLESVIREYEMKLTSGGAEI